MIFEVLEWKNKQKKKLGNVFPIFNCSVSGEFSYYHTIWTPQQRYCGWIEEHTTVYFITSFATHCSLCKPLTIKKSVSSWNDFFFSSSLYNVTKDKKAKLVHLKEILGHNWIRNVLNQGAAFFPFPFSTNNLHPISALIKMSRDFSLIQTVGTGRKYMLREELAS